MHFLHKHLLLICKDWTFHCRQSGSQFGCTNWIYDLLDCINQAVLLEKIKFCGVSGKFYNFSKILFRWKISKSNFKSQ